MCEVIFLRTGNFKSTFLERRRQGLEAFLQTLVAQDPADRRVLEFFDCRDP